MPASSQTALMAFRVAVSSDPAGLSYQHEPAAAIFPLMRTPRKLEIVSWFAFSPMASVFGSEAAELHQTGFLRVNP
ncbi:hypothetical protein JL973_11430 [Klebsiella pneumoniae]|nr:hypothetical protein [Klebsiella pneumoniae]